MKNKNKEIEFLNKEEVIAALEAHNIGAYELEEVWWEVETQPTIQDAVELCLYRLGYL